MRMPSARIVGVLVGVLVVGLVVGLLARWPGSPVRHRPAPAAGAPRVVGYFAQWDVHDRQYQVRNVQTSGAAARLTHLVYAFGSVAGGRCAVGDPDADVDHLVPAADSVDGVADTSADPVHGNIGQLRKLKAANPRLKVLWSFGGWTGSAGFTAAAKDPAGFAASCHRLLTDPRWAGVFDGIDVDWEYPNGCGLRCDASGRDALSRLTSALRTAFGRSTLITAAVTADAGRLDAADYATAAGDLDWVMAMTYDYYSSGNGRGPTAPHSALTRYPGMPGPGASAEVAIDKLTALGVPPAKVLLGIGFYGRGWTGVTQATPGGTATGPAPGTYELGVEDYRVLRTRCPATGTVGGTAYAWCDGQWWSYDTPATVRDKMAYARSRRLGGAFVWELSGDSPDGELLAAVADGLG